MGKRINVTLTDAQWTAIINAFSSYMTELTQDGESRREAMEATVLQRAFLKLRDGDGSA